MDHKKHEKHRGLLPAESVKSQRNNKPVVCCVVLGGLIY
jgi:hypothetical protein